MRIFISVGEPSGDIHGASLIRELQARHANVDIVGFGGDRMQAEGAKLLYPLVQLAVMGIVRVLSNITTFLSLLSRADRYFRHHRPDAVVLIDYPGFNMRLAKEAKRRVPTLRTIHYISPQVWAWHRGRIPKMAKFLDLMLCLFPFEIPLCAGAGLRAVCVGHPLLDSLAVEKKEHVRDTSLVALLPGSRSKEVRKIFPVMVEAAVKLRETRPSLRFEAAAASETLAMEMRSTLVAHGQDEGFCTITLRSAHDLMQRAGAGMVCSGTATLESTFFGLPMVILYRVAWLTWAVGKRLVKIPWLGLPNVLAGREIVREFLQKDAKPTPIADEMLRLLDDAKVREAQQRAQAEVIASLGERGAAKRGAEAISGMLV